MEIESADSMDVLARDVHRALEDGDLESFAELMGPNVRWGAPGDSSPPCQSRDDVLSWYRRGRERGVRASVNAVTVLGDHLLVELALRGTRSAHDRGGAALRWQLLTVAGGRITRIVGFDDRSDALAYLETADP